MTKEDIKTIIDIVHKTIYGFFDVCDEEETPMTDKDKLLLKINKAICTNIRALEQESKSEWEHDHEILKAYSDGANEMLDKVRAEIGSLPKIYPFVNHIYTYIKTSDCLQIIDNYRSESEGKA